MRAVVTIGIAGILIYWATVTVADCVIYTVQIEQSELSSSTPDSERHPAALEFRESLENGWLVACKDKDEFNQVLEYMKKLRKREMTVGK